MDRGETIGRSGMTGLAGGDHLHFSVLVGGQPGEPDRVVGSALDRRSGRPQARRGRPASTRRRPRRPPRKAAGAPKKAPARERRSPRRAAASGNAVSSFRKERRGWASKRCLRARARRRLRHAGQAAPEHARRRHDAGGLLHGRAAGPRVGAALHTLVGTALVASGASAFNQLLEIEVGRPDAADARAAAAERAHRARHARRPSASSLSIVGLVQLAWGVNLLAAARGAGHAAHLHGVLHAAQEADVARDRRRRHAGRAAADDRLGGGPQQPVDRGVDPVRHRVPLADAALPRHRVDVPRGLQARGVPAAAHRRARRRVDGPAGADLRGGAAAR